MRSISHNFGIAAISRVLGNLIGVSVVGILARTLGPGPFGEYNTIFAFLFLFQTVADMGLYTLLVRETSQHEAQEAYIVSNLTSLRFLLILTASVAACILAFIIYDEAVLRYGILIATLYIIGSSLVQVLMGVFQKHLAMRYIAIADIAARIAQLAGVILVVGIGQVSVTNFVWVVVAAEVLHVGLVVLFARRLVALHWMADLVYWKRMLSTAFPIAVSLVFVLVYFKIDTVMLSLMKPSYDVGVYTAAYKVLEVVIFLPAMFIGLILPQLSRFAGDRTRYEEIYQKTFDVLAVFACPAVILIAILARPIIGVVGGSEFVQSSAILAVLSIAIGIIFFGNLGGNALVSLNLQKKAVWIYGTGAVLNVVANIILIPRYTYYAAAWNTVVTELIVTTIMFVVVNKYSAISLRWNVFGKSVIASLLCGALVYTGRDSLLLGLLLSLSYFPLMMLMGGIKMRHLRDLVRGEDQLFTGNS